MSQNEIDRALAIGRENEAMISLGKAWCTNIRTDRAGMGVGMVEQMTGLPISGGRFTCDYAKEPGGLAAIQLAAWAVAFYESNCDGCSHRAYGGRLPNLGTWAEEQIAARDRQVATADAAAAEERAQRESRAAHRTAAASRFDAAGQGIVALINRIDLDPHDYDAVTALGLQVDLTPDAFTDELRAIVLSDAESLRSSALLDISVRLAIHHDSSTDPGLRAVCIRALVDKWAREPAAMYLAEHAEASDITTELTRNLVRVAAGESSWQGHSSIGKPEALARYHALARDEVENEIATMLRHGLESARSTAARALRHLADAEPDAALRLLPALLDGLKFTDDDHYGGDRGSDDIAHTVADILHHSPDAVDRAVSDRWGAATEGYRARLIRCYDAAVRARGDSAAPEVFRVVLARAVTVLGELPGASRVDIFEDYQSRASNLLKMAASDAPAGAIDPDVILGTLLMWIEHERAHGAAQPQSPTEALESMGTHARMRGLVRDIAGAVAAIGSQDVLPFLASCDGIYAGSDTDPEVRSEIVTIAGKVAASSGPEIGSALPLIYSAMLNDSQLVRSAGMDAAESVMRALGPESTPPLLARAAVAGLSDQYLIVVRASVKACRYIPTDIENPADTCEHLLGVAGAYAADRLQHRLVEDALSAAIRISRDHPALRPLVARASLDVIDSMDRYNARESLRHFSGLSADSKWTGVAIRALRADQDPRYEAFGDEDKDSLLRDIAKRPLSDDEMRDLVSGEVEAAKWDRRRAVRAGETLAELGRPDASVAVLKARLDAIPDTITMRPARRNARRLVLRFDVEAAIAAADHDRRREIASEVSAMSDHGDEAAE